MEKFDVVAVNIKSNKVVWVEPDRTEAGAEAVVKMACLRQGRSKQFYALVPAGKFAKGDTYSK